MISRAIMVGLCLVVVPNASSASEWAYGLFDSLEHDFGTVARGTQLTHHFAVTNTSKRDVRIKRVRVSCQCTRADALERRLAPGESTVIAAVMDTSGFQGSKSVSIFVQFDRPRRTEVALRVSCTSAGNIASSVNEVDFGVLAPGVGGEKSLQLNHAGDANWQITSVDYGNPHLFAEVVERSRTAAEVRYELQIKLKPSAPGGKHTDRIRLHTNDPKAPQVLVDVNAVVESELEIAPKSLSIANEAAGAKLTRSFVVKGLQPFRLIGVEKSSLDVQVRCAPTINTTHLVVLTVTVPPNGSELPDEIELLTDLEGDKSVVIPLQR